MSVDPPGIECMFDCLDEAELLVEMTVAVRAERVAVARRLLAAGRLCQLRTAGLEADGRAQWCIDNWEASGRGGGCRAGDQPRPGVVADALRSGTAGAVASTGAVFAAGEVDFRVVAVAVFRTGLITDPEVLTSIDTQLARCAPGWNALSQKKLVEYIDWGPAPDPAAERVDRGRDGDRHMEIEPDGGGLAELRGCLRALMPLRWTGGWISWPRASAGRIRVRPCQRRADAVAALVAGASAMVCDCGLQNCPAARVMRPGTVRSSSTWSLRVLRFPAPVTGRATCRDTGNSCRDVPPVGCLARLKPLTAGVWRAESGYRPPAALTTSFAAAMCVADFPVVIASGGLRHRPHRALGSSVSSFYVSRLSDFGLLCFPAVSTGMARCGRGRPA